MSPKQSFQLSFLSTPFTPLSPSLVDCQILHEDTVVIFVIIASVTSSSPPPSHPNTNNTTSITQWLTCRLCDASKTNATMKPGEPVSGNPQADRANSSPWSPMTRALGSTKTATTSSKNSATAMTSALRISIWNLLDEHCRQVDWQCQGHRPQTTRQAWAAITTTANTMLCWWGISKIRRCWLLILWPWLKQNSRVYFFRWRWSSQRQRCPSDGQHLRLEARCKARSDTHWRHH